MEKEIILYGSIDCHKTKHYLDVLNAKKLAHTFYDVKINVEKGDELRSLYKSGKLNYPTLLLDGKKLRNPSDMELDNWLIKKRFISGTNYSKDLTFSCGIDASRHDVGDAIEY